MATNKQSIIPEEYTLGDMKEYSIDDFVKDRINQAYNKSQEIQSGIMPPSWWFAYDKEGRLRNGEFYNCIGTATSLFGDESTEIGNLKFLKNYKEKGFRKLDDGEPDEIGDIHQMLYDDDTPYHSLLLTKINDDGSKLYSYGNGGFYKSLEPDEYNEDFFIKQYANDNYVSSYVKNKKYEEYPEGMDKNKMIRYRFVGTPQQISELNEHNKKVKEHQNKLGYVNGKLNKLEPQQKSLETKKLDAKNETAKYLEKFIHR